MPRTSIVLTERQMEALRKLSQETGLRFSELLRRIIDEYLAKQGERQ